MLPINGPSFKRAVVNPQHAFLNIPYDDDFRDLFLAYIAALTAFGLVPRATLEVPGGSGRLDRILGLIASCGYSFHDLSRVELDVKNPPTPRFNMPFELGLAVGNERLGGRGTWFVFEAKKRRLSKSLSDLAGSDPYVHGGKPNGVFREICNCLVREPRQPKVSEISKIYRALKRVVPEIQRDAASRSLFSARIFQNLILAAQTLAAHNSLGPSRMRT